METFLPILSEVAKFFTYYKNFKGFSIENESLTYADLTLTTVAFFSHLSSKGKGSFFTHMTAAAKQKNGNVEKARASVPFVKNEPTANL